MEANLAQCIIVVLILDVGWGVGREEEGKRANYTIEEERALKTYFANFLKHHKGPGMDDGEIDSTQTSF